MFSKYALMFVFLLKTSQTFSADIFKISPYPLNHTNGHLLLNFQLNSDKKIVIEDGERTFSERNYKKDEHYQIELSVPECGVTKDIRMKENKEVIFTKVFPPRSCEENKSTSDYTFGFISDTQQYAERHAAVAKVIAYHHSIDPLQFIINGGDVVQNGDKDEQEWINYFLSGSAYLMDIPQIAAVGNHDYRGISNKSLPKFFKKYLRWDGSPENGNLFFEMPGFQLVIWNSNSSNLADPEEKEMWKWLEEKMQMAQKSNTPFILATHFPVFSSSLNRFTSASVKILQARLVPLAEKYGIKLILSGHTHMFERSYKDGVNYLVAGPAGGRANRPSYKNIYKQSFDASALTFTKVKYSNKTLKLETFNQDNVLIDQLLVKL